MNETRLRFERREAVAILTLDRPDAGNAIDIAMADAILAAALECEADDAIRCVVLTGAGRMFCTGGDVKAFGEAGSAVPALVSRLTAPLHMAVARLLHMRKPLITAINGPAAGAGIGLAVMGDAAFAARSAQFALGYGSLGLSPDAGATWLLPRLVGMRHAQRLLLLGERIDAEEAERIGLVTRMVEDENLLPEALALAERLSRSAVRAGWRTRELLLASLDTGLETHLEREAQGIAAASREAEAREGIPAFINKRKPDFRGAGEI
jgi:2-(1,2-epoxy-1,2-dihydrophenyl)acetyl-CoA isomerase